MIGGAVIECAIEAAQKGGRKLLEFDGPSLDRTVKSAEWDFVTEADIAAEKEVLGVLQKYFPEDCILAEESGWIGSRHAEAVWTIDPLDGTHNFADGSHNYGTMVTRVVGNEVQAAVVYNPALDILAVGEKGKGTWMNGVRIQREEHVDFSEANVLAEFWADFPHTESISYIRSTIQEMGKNPNSLRSCAANTLALLSGDIDAWCSHAWFPWDFLPMQLLTQEAGMKATDIYGGSLTWNKEDQSMLVGVTAVYEEIRARINMFETKQ